MKRTQTLQHRIVIAFFLLTLLLCGSFAAVVYFVIHELETKLFYDHLQQDATWLINASRQGVELELPEGIQLYQTRHGSHRKLPDYLRQLEVGKHEVVLSDRAYHVIVRKQEGERYYFVQDQSRFEETEIAVGIGILLAFVGALIGALWLGYTTASKVIAPVIRLANQVRDLDQPLSNEQFSSDEVGQLATTFQEYSQRLYRFLDRERLFTGDVSHELRTPLMVISGACELLLTQSTLDDKSRQRLLRIERASQEMKLLVETFLMLSREGKGAALTAQPIAVIEIIEEELAELRHSLSDKPIEINLQRVELLQLNGSAPLFRVAIRNLLRNAFHYTQQGSIVVIVGSASIEVRDSGPGIPESLQATLFDRHVQGEQSYVNEGQGLGLSIVKRICRYHGWSVDFSPLEPHGSLFRLRFSDRSSDL